MSAVLFSAGDYRLVDRLIDTRCARSRNLSYPYAGNLEARWALAHAEAHRILHRKPLGEVCIGTRDTLREVEADFGALQILVPRPVWREYTAPFEPTCSPGDILAWRLLMAHRWQDELHVSWHNLGLHIVRTLGDPMTHHVWARLMIGTEPRFDEQLADIVRQHYPVSWARWAPALS